jgi:glycosyltransferase involved in cell wall biosynthesis
MRRARFAATPVHAWPVLVGTKLAQTRAGARLVTWIQRREAGTPSVPHMTTSPARGRRANGRNVLFVSHCDFSGNSAFHVFSIAKELERRGWFPAIAVPRGARGVRDLGGADFRVLTYRSARRSGLTFPDGNGPDLVHAFTPRQHVRNLTLNLVDRYGCPYVVHLEDNEFAVRGAVASDYDVVALDSFVAGAAGMTVVIDRLLELKPADMPAAIIWPGYDVAIERPRRARDLVRRDLSLRKEQLAVLYPGNVHDVNLDEVRSLYEAMQSLRASGRDVVLVKSGWNRVDPSLLPSLGAGICDLGWISRRRIPELLGAADVLVQPGSPGPFNDYRFPSKLPEFLASGRPVVLPRSNIGLHLDDEVEAMVLDHGGAEEISEKVAALADDPELRAQMGKRGRAFALRELQWSTNVGEVVAVYEALPVAAA